MKTIQEILKSRTPLLFDGATGTELYKRGIFINRCFEEANLTDRAMVLGLHNDYADAGADVLTTNSWGAGFYKLKGHSLQNKLYDINFEAARIAREAAGDYKAAHSHEAARDRLLVAGSVGPLGVRMEPFGSLAKEEAFAAYREQIKGLVDGGIDFVLFETFLDVDEEEQAILAARDVKPDIPIFACLTIDLSGNLSSGISLEEAIGRLADFGADVVGLNCSVGPQPMLTAVKRIMKHVDLPVIAQPNAGLPKEVDGRMIYMSTPEYFAQYAKYFLEEGVQFVGGCCGTTPEHIRAMARTMRQHRAMAVGSAGAASERTAAGPGGVRAQVGAPAGAAPTRAAAESAAGTASDVEPRIRVVPFAEKSKWAAKLARGETVYSLELVPPAGIAPEALIENAARAKEAGIDAINIPDGPRACSRMSTIVTAIMVEQRVGVETILHCTCRDRNLISMQSELLGAHAIGLRNVLCITGDPPKLGDYPNATGVFDIDSVGLTKMVHLLNSGFDVAGRPIGEPTSLSHGVGVNPGHRNFDFEMERLWKKIEAGAEWVVTQPVFDAASMEAFLNYLVRHDLKIPVIMGIWPLSSLKNAQFMKNEMPGIEISDSLLKRMAAPATLQAARDEGVAIAREMYETMKDSIQGVQLSAPFGRIDLALRVVGK